MARNAPYHNNISALFALLRDVGEDHADYHTVGRLMFLLIAAL